MELQGKVWIGPDHPTHSWAVGTIISHTDTVLKVKDDAGAEFEVARSGAQMVHASCEEGVGDLLTLGDFNEAALLHNIRVRYFKDEIYCGIGSPILISVNPYAVIDGLYGPETEKKFAEAGEDAPPHIYTIAQASYAHLRSERSGQSILITGESGAGKTEATKRMLRYLANNAGSNGADPGSLSIEDQVVQSNPVLEAFGNAKTVRNDNSSRFGKFIKVKFENGTGAIHSASICNYLLEKTRVVGPNADERNYHIFYQLCAVSDAALKEDLALPAAADNAITKAGGTLTVEGVDDAVDLKETQESMVRLGFTSSEQVEVLRITAAIVHLGDVGLVMDESRGEGPHFDEDTRPGHACRLLGVEMERLRKVVGFRSRVDPISKALIESPHTQESGQGVILIICKALYARLFNWLISRINTAMARADDSSLGYSIIGLLDIYGFEVFELNSFEQLCINFANEKLQQHFNSHMFRLEQAMYSEEGIDWEHIEWEDNQPIIDALEKKASASSPPGVFVLLDSECLMPKATDQSFLQTIFSSFQGTPNDKVVTKAKRVATSEFAVTHYAAKVVYNVAGFLVKNMDRLDPDVVNLFQGLPEGVLSSFFEAAEAKPSKTVTVGSQFRGQLDELVSDLQQTYPRYVRCIKPNGRKAVHDFDSQEVLRQLRCAGMLEAIRIRRAGYGARRSFAEFVQRYGVICSSLKAGDAVSQCKEALEQICEMPQIKEASLPSPPYQMGKTKIFMKEQLQQALEELLTDAVAKRAVRVQSFWKMRQARARYMRQLVSARQLQAILRTCGARTEFLAHVRKKRSATAIQACYRKVVRRRKYLHLRDAALRLQKFVRKRASHRVYMARLKAAVALQAQLRTFLWTRKTAAALEAAREAARQAEVAYRLEVAEKKVEEQAAEILRQQQELESAQTKLGEASSELEKVRSESQLAAQARDTESQKREELEAQLQQVTAEAAATQEAAEARRKELEDRVAAAEAKAEQGAAEVANGRGALEASVAVLEQRAAEAEASAAKHQEESEKLAAQVAALREQAPEGTVPGRVPDTTEADARIQQLTRELAAAKEAVQAEREINQAASARGLHDDRSSLSPPAKVNGVSGTDEVQQLRAALARAEMRIEDLLRVRAATSTPSSISLSPGKPTVAGNMQAPHHPDDNLGVRTRSAVVRKSLDFPPENLPVGSKEWAVLLCAQQPPSKLRSCELKPAQGGVEQVLGPDGDLAAGIIVESAGQWGVVRRDSTSKRYVRIDRYGCFLLPKAQVNALLSKYTCLSVVARP
mmetsp:Transcript_33960/g.88535  ORF Transcript_33960/g.88535 Transcript_33960/m.88535 type:complete len:1277 (+) Transcript_33960:19-3849(+)